MPTANNTHTDFRRFFPLRKWLWIFTPFFLFLLLDQIFPLVLPNHTKMFAQVVVDQHGHPLRAFPDSKGVWRYETTLDQVSPYYLEALLTYEDRRFWYHPGVDPLAVLRAITGNIIHGRAISGGSTITMQVGRLLHPHSKTLRGKLHQMFRALQLEWHLSKTEILTLYCNIAPFGGTIEGVQAASYTYLNKPAKELSRAEAALLVVLPQSPTRYRPDLHPQRAQTARDKVLNRMVEMQQWNIEDVTQAKLEDVYAIRTTIDQHAPLLSRRLKNKIHAKVIQTYIDGDLQIALEDYLHNYITSQPKQTSAAILVVDNHTGHVKAYIGTAIFGDVKRFGHVDMVQATRSPGSTLKPFLYALALDEGLIHSHSLLIDAPSTWGTYRPGNFSGSFAGPVSATEALQRSLNVPAVALFDKLGPQKFTDRLSNAGLPLSIPGQKPTLPVILGGAGTSLEDLVKAYMAFANRGKTIPLHFSFNHDALQKPEKFFFSPQAAWIVQDMLTGISRPGGIRKAAAIRYKNSLAWKTGTSYGSRDAWAIGLDANHTIGVWLGRPDSTAVSGNGGRITAGPLLHAIADHLNTEVHPIPKPQGINQQTICWPLGTLASEQDKAFCHKRHSAWIMNKTIPPTWPDQHAPFATNPLAYWVESSAKDAARVHSGCAKKPVKQLAALWPISIEPWLPNQWKRGNILPRLSPNCNLHLSNGVRLSIEGIENNNIYRAAGSSNVRPQIQLLAQGGTGRHHWYINGQHHRSTNSATYHTLELVEKGKMQIVVTDDGGNTDKVEIQVQ